MRRIYGWGERFSRIERQGERMKEWSRDKGWSKVVNYSKGGNKGYI